MALFRSSRPAPPRLGCFGKLPTYGDFVSLHQDSEDAQAFADWMQQGMGHIRGALPGPADQLVCFAFRPPGAKRALIGSFWPSADAAGRVFPFTLFISVPAASLAHHGAYQAFAVDPLWRQLQELYAQMHALPTLQEQYTLLQGATPAEVLEPQDAANAFPGRLPVVPLDQAPPVPLALQVRDVTRLADELGRAPQMPEFALRLRIHEGMDPATEASVWARMLFAYAGEAEHGTLFLRMSRYENERSALFVHRELRAEDLGYLLQPTPDYHMADSVGYRIEPASPEEQQFGNAFQSRWLGSARSCQDLLELGTRQWTAAELAAAPDVSATAATTPAIPAPPLPDDDDEITSEVDMGDLASVHEHGGEEATGPVDEGGITQAPAIPPPPDANSTAPVEANLAAVRAQTGVLLESVLALLERPLLAGQLLTVPDPSGNATRNVYVPADSGQAKFLPGGVEPKNLEMQIRDFENAKRQIEELGRQNRALEQALETRLIAATREAERGASWM